MARRNDRWPFERYVREASAAAKRSGTITLLVSHRLSTVRMADWVIVMGESGIVEQGTHADLLASGGLYAELFELQARSYR